MHVKHDARLAANTNSLPFMRPDPASQSNALIERLNRLRSVRDIPTEALGQIRFAAQGLRNSDPSCFLSINGMIAALEHDADALDAMALELAGKYPDAVQDQLNVVRSYTTIRARRKAESYGLAVLDRLRSPNPWVVGWMAYAMLLNGSLQRSNEVVGRYRELLRVEEAGSLRDTARILERMRVLEIDEENFSRYLDTSHDALARRGWKSPALVIKPPLSDDDGGYPAAILSFLLDAEAEETLNAADAVMDALDAADNPLFTACALVVFVESDR